MVKKVSKWLEVSVFVEADRIEAVASIMERYGYGGAVIEEEYDEHDRKTFVIRAYLPCDHSLNRKKKELEQELGRLSHLGLKLKSRFTEPRDWINGWKRFFKARNVGEKLVIRPSWGSYSSHPGKVVIEIDPGMAFGTGHHATTRLCLVAIEKHLSSGMTLLDLGTGTGILAIAAAKLGASSVLALDTDPVAIGVARTNVGMNGVVNDVQVKKGTINQRVQRSLLHNFDMVFANITADVIADFSARIAVTLKQDGKFIAGGINREGLAKVKASLLQAGLRIVESYSDEGWYTVVAVLNR